MNNIFNKFLFVFDLANNHCGDLNHGLEIIKRVADECKYFPQFNFGFKFQYRNLDTFIHSDYKNNFDFKYIKRFTETRLSDEDFLKMKKLIESYEFFTVCTPFDEESVDKIEEQNFDIIKIASCSITDWPLLEKITDTNLPIIASIGDRPFEEIDKVYEFFKHRDKEFAFLHCVAEYPVQKENVELNQIDLLRERYPGIKTGFSSHEAPGINNTDSVQIAIAKNTNIFECHIDIDCLTKNKYSRTHNDINFLLKKALDTLILCGIDSRRPISEEESKALFGLRRGVFAKRFLNRGEKITKDDIYFAIPLLENSLSANDISKYINYEVIEDINKDEALYIDKISSFDKEPKIREIYNDVKDFLIKSGVAIPEKFKVDLSHHYGLDRFYKYGTAIITFFNREYAKKLLVVLPNQQHPEHKHILKEETFSVLDGELDLTIAKENDSYFADTLHLNIGEYYTVERKIYHSFFSRHGCILEEVSTTQFPNDSVYTDESIMNNKDRKTTIMFSK